MFLLLPPLLLALLLLWLPRTLLQWVALALLLLASLAVLPRLLRSSGF